MANARALDKRRKSIRNIRKITRTMELIATARYKKAMDRAAAATAYTDQIIANRQSAWPQPGLEVQHPLLEQRDNTEIGSRVGARPATADCAVVTTAASCEPRCRGSRNCKDRSATSPSMSAVNAGSTDSSFAASRPTNIHCTSRISRRTTKSKRSLDSYLEQYVTGQIDRLDVIYTKFISTSQADRDDRNVVAARFAGRWTMQATKQQTRRTSNTNSCRRPKAFLEEVVPTSFKVKLFKCFLDAAVSEQVARMIAMKGATENAGDMIKQLSMTYNRARQSQITGEIMEIIGGVEALEG